MKYGLLIFLIVIVSCTGDSLFIEQGALEGKWIDFNTKTDTLTFEFIGDKESMMLSRGMEMRTGFLLPKYGSGSYDYKLLTGDSISLRWSLSANSDFNDYYFKQEVDQITIEKFFDTTTSGILLTFKKVD
jgi:hypothetical protein